MALSNVRKRQCPCEGQKKRAFRGGMAIASRIEQARESVEATGRFLEALK